MGTAATRTPVTTATAPATSHARRLRSHWRATMTPARTRQATPDRDPVSTTDATPTIDNPRLHHRCQPARKAAMMMPVASSRGTWTTAEPPMPVASRGEWCTRAERGHCRKEQATVRTAGHQSTWCAGRVGRIRTTAKASSRVARAVSVGASR